MGSLYRRKGSKYWWVAYCVNGRQTCESTHTTNKRRAEKILAKRQTEIFERRFHLPRSAPPYFEEWADQFLSKVTHPNTRKRYGSSIRILKDHFAGMRLSNVSAEQIEQFKEARIQGAVQAATVNHDLRVLRRMMRLAERNQLIVRNPFAQVDFLKQRTPRQPHIVTYEEEEKLLKVAPPYLRVLVVLILETGMRSHREALALRWDAIDVLNNVIRVKESKTAAGIRNVFMSARCKRELMQWRDVIGTSSSPFVFSNLRTPTVRPMTDIRGSWAKALKDAGIDYFCIYNLRHTFASRLSAAGVSDVFVAQMIGHSRPSILQIYSKATDEYRRDAIRRLEDMRREYADSRSIATPVN